MEEYMSISSDTIANKNKNSKSDITVKYGVKKPTSPTGTSTSGKLTKSQYSTYALSVSNYINKYNTAPSYVSTKIGKIQFQTFIYANSRILAWSNDNKGVLPSSLTLSVAKTHAMNKYLPKFPGNPVVVPNNTNTNNTNTNNNTNNNGTNNNGNNNSSSISLNNIKDAAIKIKVFVNENGVLPNQVEIAGKQYTMSQFLYLLSAAIVNINNGNNGNINPISVNSPNGPIGDSMKGNFKKSEFITLANNVLTYIKDHKQAHNYANSKLGRIKFQSLVYEFSKILEYENSSGALPNNITVNISANGPLYTGNGTSSNGTVDGFVVIYGSNYACGPTLVKYNSQYLISTGKCSCGDAGDYIYHTSTFKNYCPYDNIYGCMIYEEGKSCPEGMWACTICDADFCLVTVRGHINKTIAKHLTIAEYIENQSIAYVAKKSQVVSVNNENNVSENNNNNSNSNNNSTKNISNLGSENKIISSNSEDANIENSNNVNYNVIQLNSKEEDIIPNNEFNQSL